MEKIAKKKSKSKNKEQWDANKILAIKMDIDSMKKAHKLNDSEWSTLKAQRVKGKKLNVNQKEDLCDVEEKVEDKTKRKKEKRKYSGQSVGTQNNNNVAVTVDTQSGDDEDGGVEQDGGLNNLSQYTSEQLKCMVGIESARQKKKKKKQQENQRNQKGDSHNKEKQRNAEYLQRWKHSRDQWKFEKLRQISIQQSMLDENKVDNEMWANVMEYLAGAQGSAKQKIAQLMEAEINKLDVECTAANDVEHRQKILDSIRYQRARQLLQQLG